MCVFFVCLLLLLFFFGGGGERGKLIICALCVIPLLCHSFGISKSGYHSNQHGTQSKIIHPPSTSFHINRPLFVFQNSHLFYSEEKLASLQLLQDSTVFLQSVGLKQSSLLHVRELQVKSVVSFLCVCFC